MKWNVGSEGLILKEKAGKERRLSGLLSANPAASTAITGATETSAAFSTASVTIPANYLRVGSVVRIRAQGICTATTGSETHIFEVKLGSVTLAATGNIDPATNDVFDAEFDFVVRAIGASGTVVGSGVVRSGPRATASPAVHYLATGATSTSTAAADFTAALALTFCVDRQSTSTDSDSMRLDRFEVSVVL